MKADDRSDRESVRGRYARELRHEVDAERHRVCLAWLPIVDGLDATLERTGNEDDPAVTIGVRSMRDQAVALLASLGFPRDDETGVPFDPERHEAAEQVDDPEVAPGTVVKVLRPGYGHAPDRRLRPATVQISRRHD